MATTGVEDLIIDTDMSIDVDDVGMLCAAHALVDLGEARILAVLHDSGATHGIGAVSVINRYFGRDGIALGAYTGPIGKPGPRSAHPEFTNEGQGWYVDELVKRFMDDDDDDDDEDEEDDDIAAAKPKKKSKSKSKKKWLRTSAAGLD